MAPLCSHSVGNERSEVPKWWNIFRAKIMNNCRSIFFTKLPHNAPWHISWPFQDLPAIFYNFTIDISTRNTKFSCPQQKHGWFWPAASSARRFLFRWRSDRQCQGWTFGKRSRLLKYGLPGWSDVSRTSDSKIQNYEKWTTRQNYEKVSGNHFPLMASQLPRDLPGVSRGLPAIDALVPIIFPGQNV